MDLFLVRQMQMGIRKRSLLFSAWGSTNPPLDGGTYPGLMAEVCSNGLPRLSMAHKYLSVKFRWIPEMDPCRDRRFAPWPWSPAMGSDVAAWSEVPFRRGTSAS
jgi:hypothetical protein